jgi:tRNA 2-selenouridine synthase
VLGNLPDEPQPSQKMFDSLLWSALAALDPSRPVYVEAESKKIGTVQVPPALIETMWKSECVVLESPVGVRVALLKDEYAHFLEHPESLLEKLQHLVPLHGHAVIDTWTELAKRGQWDELTADLLVRHYDPAYTRAINNHYPALSRAPRLKIDSPDDEAFDALARRCVETETRREKVPA